MGKQIWFARRWRFIKIRIGLMLLELPLTVACLALTGVSDPNTYRTQLWQNGADMGFNSAPNSILYFYANWLPAKVPLVWSQYQTTWNVVVSILGVFVLLVKSALLSLHIYLPPISVVVDALFVALFSVAVYNQAAPDMSDPEHPSPGLPWYLSKGCKYAEQGNWSYCMQARALFGVCIVMIALFTVDLIYSIWSCIPTEQEKAARLAEYEADLEMKKLSMYQDEEADTEEQREAHRQMFMNLPKTPNTPGFGGLNPMTPRTKAFTTLNGGPPPSSSSHGAGPSGTLPLRNYQPPNVSARQ